MIYGNFNDRNIFNASTQCISDPWLFDTDPDPRIHTTRLWIICGFQDANKNKFLPNVFRLLLTWRISPQRKQIVKKPPNCRNQGFFYFWACSLEDPDPRRAKNYACESWTLSCRLPIIDSITCRPVLEKRIRSEYRVIGFGSDTEESWYWSDLRLCFHPHLFCLECAKITINSWHCPNIPDFQGSFIIRQLCVFLKPEAIYKGKVTSRYIIYMISIADTGSGIRCFSDPWFRIWDTFLTEPDLGSRSQTLKPIFKRLKFFVNWLKFFRYLTNKIICEFFRSVQNLIIWHLLYSREKIPNYLFRSLLTYCKYKNYISDSI